MPNLPIFKKIIIIKITSTLKFFMIIYYREVLVDFMFPAFAVIKLSLL